MQHLITAILVVLFTISRALATEWRPFVAVSGLMDVPSTDASGERYELRLETSTYMYPGTEFEFGIRHAKYEWYAAYHLSHSPQRDTYSSYVASFTDSSRTEYQYAHQEFRSEQRFLLGHRFWPVKAPEAKVNPFIGLGAELGFSMNGINTQVNEVEYEYDSTGTRFSHHRVLSSDAYKHRDSSNAYGGLVEVGTSFEIWGQFEALVITQLHAYVIENKFWLHRYYDLYLMPSGVLQLRYMF